MPDSLTPEVFEEAIRPATLPTSVIIAYHPPLFKPLRSITLANPLQSTLLECIANGISVYSPHTALDNVTGGINDWLAEGLTTKEVLARTQNTTTEVKHLGELKAEKEGVEVGVGRMVTYSQPIDLQDII
jgi:putative NIF3 family GTP cyclohydrolase 1 type 2